MRRALRWLGGAALLLATCGAAGLYFAPSSVTPEAIARSVDHDPERLAAAYALPTAATFPRALHWQANGSLCGPASVVNVRRSLGLDAIDEAAVLDGTGRCWTGACIP
ncbi:MAG: phytochelatin synthase, partial [Myxococcales bacterium]|nr:phytochelatin synthase [Myxococcales bacterium]